VKCLFHSSTLSGLLYQHSCCHLFSPHVLNSKQRQIWVDILTLQNTTLPFQPIYFLFNNIQEKNDLTIKCLNAVYFAEKFKSLRKSFFIAVVNFKTCVNLRNEMSKHVRMYDKSREKKEVKSANCNLEKILEISYI
jgi:hypothetical protein